MSDAWRSYWSEKRNSEHRSKPGFYERTALEKRVFLGSGGRLLDFACGAAELLVHYAPSFDEVIGADFSATMLDAARLRLKAGGAQNVELLLTDDVAVWHAVRGLFDCISVGAAVQYFSPVQLHAFTTTALGRLRPHGRIVYFDIVDPHLYWMWALGFFEQEKPRASSVVRRAVATVRETLRRRCDGRGPLTVGYGYRPWEICRLAARLGMTADISWSSSYEYRFHAVLERVVDSREGST